MCRKRRWSVINNVIIITQNIHLTMLQMYTLVNIMRYTIGFTSVERLSFMTILYHFGRVIPNIHVTLDIS